MANPVIFRRGYSDSIPSLGMDADSLYFIEDENTLYKSTGLNKPLARYSDVQSGFADLADLEIKVPVGVQGKLYLTNNNHIYFYADAEWKSITAEAQLDAIEASKVNYNNTVSTLGSSTVQLAIDELDVKVEDIDEALDSLETELDKVIADVATLNTDLTDLETDVVANTTNINQLSGVTDNIQNQINLLTEKLSETEWEVFEF